MSGRRTAPRRAAGPPSRPSATCSRRERFGMRFGLDRMHRLMNVLELPRVPYPTVHVVGTNGKSSTTRMIAALLERHGLRTGCFTSPHLLSYRERIRIGERDIAPGALRARRSRGRSRRPSWSTARRREPGDAVTQFELLTACRARASSRRRASTSRCSRRGWAGATTRPTSSTRASPC